MARDYINDHVKIVISKITGVNIEKIQNEYNLQCDLGIDSLDITQLIIELEEEFDIECVKEDFIQQIQTVDDVIKYIKNTI